MEARRRFGRSATARTATRGDQMVLALMVARNGLPVDYDAHFTPSPTARENTSVAAEFGAAQLAPFRIAFVPEVCVQT